MRLQTPAPAKLGIPVLTGVASPSASKFSKDHSMTELDSRIKLRSSLRCDGIGRLDCAEDLESGQRLAVRWLPLEANGEAAVKACERLPHHPMLPRIRQTGKMGSMAFLALDFPEGSLLSTILGDRLDTGVVLQMASQLADALATVHGQGVVHGEFGSDSVLMVGDKSYLWDLPLVIANRLTDRRGENRLMQNLVRVVPYLAPERARGAGASCEADVYSLGALLCICAGAPMPADSTTLGTVYSIAQGQWVPRVPSTIPQPYHAMIERMISADATERPAAQDVAKLFAQPMHSGSLPTVPDMPMIRLPPELQARANALLKSPPPVMPEPESVMEVASADLTDVVPDEVSVTAATPLLESAEMPVVESAPTPVSAIAAEAAEAEAAAVAVAVAVTVEAPVEAPQAALSLVSAPAFAAVAVPPVETSVEPVAVEAAAPVASVETEVLAAPVEAKAEEPDEVPEAAANDVLQLPTIELPKVMVVESIPAQMSPPMPTTSVALSDSVSVSPEMVRDGASMFSLYTEPEKAPMTMWWVAVGVVMLIVGLLVLAVNLVGKASGEMPLPPPVAAPVQKVAPAVEAAPAAIEAAPPVPATDPLAAPAVDGPGLLPPPAAAPAPATAPETKLSPAKPRGEEMVDLASEDVLSPLTRAKAARPATRKNARVAKAPMLAAPVAAPVVAAPVAKAAAPVVEEAPAAPASPDDFFPDPPVTIKEPVVTKESRADSKRPNP